MNVYNEESGLHKYAQDIEREIAERLIDKVLADGHVVSVHEGEDWAIRESMDRDAILASMASTDADKVYIWKDGERKGWFWLIYGNGNDLISDFVSNTYCCEAVNHAIQEELFT